MNGTGRAMCAGTVAFGLVFAAGFAFGTLRTIVIVPRLGETTAVLLELPAMLALSWIVTGWAVRRWQVPAGFARVVMGSVAFALLMLAELALGVALFGETVQGWGADLIRPPGLYGLLSQIAFGLMPLVHGTPRRDR